jgi:hypothetical protein
MKKLLRKALAPILGRLLPLYLDVKTAKEAPVGTEFPIEGALPDLRALGAEWEFDLIARKKAA